MSQQYDVSVITNFYLGKVYGNNQILLDDPKSAVILLSLHKAAKEVTRYSFIGGEAYMLSELIPDEMPHYSSRDDRSIRLICMNTLWHLYGDLMTSLRSFVPNNNELLVSLHSIILDCIETPSNRPIILKLREEL